MQDKSDTAARDAYPIAATQLHWFRTEQGCPTDSGPTNPVLAVVLGDAQHGIFCGWFEFQVQIPGEEPTDVFRIPARVNQEMDIYFPAYAVAYWCYSMPISETIFLDRGRN